MTKPLVLAALVLSSIAASSRSSIFASRTPIAGGKRAADRVFEIRTYTTLPGRLDALNARFREHTMRIFAKHGMTSIGYWIPQDSARLRNTLVYIIAHESRAKADENWKAFGADPEWQRVAAASEADGKIVEKIESVYVSPTDYSPIK